MESKNDLNSISSAFKFADGVCDYIPFLSTFTNLVDIFEKGALKAASLDEKTGKKLGENHYFKHLRDDKSLLVCIGLLIPFINILVKYSYDQEIKNKEATIAKKLLDQTLKSDQQQGISFNATPTNSSPRATPHDENIQPNPFTPSPTQSSLKTRIAEKKDESKQEVLLSYNKLKEKNKINIQNLENKISNLAEDNPQRNLLEQALVQFKETAAKSENSLLEIARSRGIDV